MRASSFIAASLGAAVLVVAGSGPSLAGEINGTGNPPGGEGLGTLHAHSICAFSGLEDGDGAGFPGPGGAPPQNWGHVRQGLRAEGATPAQIKASGIQPGDSCNGHTGFLAGGGGE
jgi:hypothetical protein